MTAQTIKSVLGVIFLLILIGTALAAPRTFVVKETEFVKISVDAKDADDDNVTYAYAPPLDAKGEWQTEYGDEGEYYIKVIASDGTTEAVEFVKLVVEKRNRPPVALQQRIKVKEGDLVSLTETVSDPDENPLVYEFKQPFNAQGKWQTRFVDAGTFVTTFTVSDGEFTLPVRMEVEVRGTNQPPQIVETFAPVGVFAVSEDQLTDFTLRAEDPDRENVTYRWLLDGALLGSEARVSYYFNYSSAGEHLLSVVSIFSFQH